MSERSFRGFLPDYERKVWNAHHSAVPLRPRGEDDLPSHHKREYEKLKKVWNWGVGLHNQGGAIRLEKEVQGLERKLENFRVDAPGEKDRVSLDVLREDLRRWQRLRKDATERVEEGSGDEAVGPREEDRYGHILADTTYEELQKTANLAVRGRKEALDKGMRRRAKVQFKLQVCRDLVRRARSSEAIKRLKDEDAKEADPESVQSDDHTPDPWEENAAMMHAYFSNHGAPEYLGEVDEIIAEEGLLDSFSHEHAWKKLREEGWALSKGNIQSLVDALENWAEDFEKKYGARKADRLAYVFDWPSCKDQT
ncbi:hypothetical protein [Salinibacter ruber]|uniref:hypothetical protein n=1 Tax=Salinibacter ruber TaxID=146919 RepID=UPI0021678AD7|nr:hypothetical protein [Salinibacter ruber]MCS4195929.1 hypothetical protein [Salinibacter ruber]